MALTLPFHSPGSFHRISWDILHDMQIALWMGDVIIENHLCKYVTCHHCIPGSSCMSKQAPFFACTTCRRLTPNASNYTNSCNFQQWLEQQGFRWRKWRYIFVSRATPGRSCKRIRNLSDFCHSHYFPQLFQWKEPWVREGSSGDETRPQNCDCGVIRIMSQLDPSIKYTEFLHSEDFLNLGARKMGRKA